MEDKIVQVRWNDVVDSIMKYADLIGEDLAEQIISEIEDEIDEEKRLEEMNYEMLDYCERYEPTYDETDGSM